MSITFDWLWPSKAEATGSKCPHCKTETETGTRGGCAACGRVKHTKDGRRLPKEVQS